MHMPAWALRHAMQGLLHAFLRSLFSSICASSQTLYCQLAAAVQQLGSARLCREPLEHMASPDRECSSPTICTEHLGCIVRPRTDTSWHCHYERSPYPAKHRHKLTLSL